jgi:hypothetical protein
MRVTINIQRLAAFELWMKNAFLAQHNSVMGHSDTAVSNAARARTHPPGYDTFDSQQGIRLVATIVINVEPNWRSGRGIASACARRQPFDTDSVRADSWVT